MAIINNKYFSMVIDNDDTNSVLLITSDKPDFINDYDNIQLQLEEILLRDLKDIPYIQYGMSNGRHKICVTDALLKFRPTQSLEHAAKIFEILTGEKGWKYVATGRLTDGKQEIFFT